LAELTIIKDEWALYKNERFLLHDNKLNSDDRIIIFALDEGLKYLTEAHTWYCDGNFSLSPENFLQLYVFRVKKFDVFVTVVYCFLQKKKL